MLSLHSAGWQRCLINVVDGDPFPCTHSRVPQGPAVGPLIFPLATMLTSVSYIVPLLKLRSSSLSAMNAMLCDREAQRCKIISLP